MQVMGFFRITGGYNLFVGAVEGGGPRSITAMAPRRCDVILDGRVVQMVTLVGEFRPRRREPGGPVLRSVYTFERVALDGRGLDGHDCRLIEHAA